MRSRVLWLTVLMVFAALVLPGSVRAQQLGAIAGEVTDATGAVLPGVTVEVASPALIEGTRTAVSDGRGRYSIESLRPGTYAVTFTLAGFSVVKREGVSLNAGFTAPVNAVMKVGSLSETVTVTGASPTVDVRNVRTQAVLDHETLNVLPTAGNVSSFATLTLGVTLSGNAGSGGIDVGGSGGEMGTASIHNARADDMKIQQEGMGTNNSMASNGGILHMGQHYNMEAISEVTMSSNGMSAETETAGLQINYIPKDGGNKLSATARYDYANESMSANNLTAALIARGTTTPAKNKRIYDRGFAVGGPIKKDHLWFFSAHRWWGAESYVPGSFFNSVQGTKAPNGRPLYVADLGRRGFSADPSQENSVRLTYQASTRDKITFYGNRGNQCLCGRGISANRAPEAGQRTAAPGNHLYQGTWTRTQSNKVLVESGLTMLINPFVHFRADNVTKTDIPVTEISPAFTYNAFDALGIPYNQDDPSHTDQNNARVALSYVTGSHSMKFGFTWMHGWIEQKGGDNELPGFGPVTFTTNLGVPISLTLIAHPQFSRSDFRNMGLYAQDQWAVKRLTLNLGVREDIFDGWTPDQDSPASLYVQGFHVSKISGTPKWRNISPRLGVAYDLKGDGKTAFKAAAGRYVAGQGTGLPLAINPANAISRTVSRTWSDANNDFFPNGDPKNPSANGELGPSSNAAFGTAVITSFFSPDMLTKNRPYTWQMSATVDREVRGNMRVSASYFRTSHFNQTVVDNERLAPSSWDPYSVTVPANSLLPGGGGSRISGLADISFAGRATVPRNTTKVDTNFGDRTEVYNGVDVDTNIRFGKGGLFRGGFTVGRTVVDGCFVIDSPQALYQCHVVTPVAGNAQVKFSGSYPAPFGFELSAVYQNLPGVPIQATVTFFNADVAGSLGRNLSACPAATGACSATVTVNALTPNANYEGRIQQLDFRIAKLIRGPFGRVRATFDLYNALNAAPILARSNAFGTAGVGWGRPTAIMSGRLIKVGVQFSWN